MADSKDYGATQCIACPLRKLPAFASTAVDPDFTQKLKKGEYKFATGETIIKENGATPHFYTILSGWAFSYRMLPDGRRQILDVKVAGDLIGIQSAMLATMTHGVDALTEVTACAFARDRFFDLFRYPEIAYNITWLASAGECALEQALLSMGRKNAIERTAYLLWYLYEKGKAVGLVKDNRLFLPMTQTQIADTLGQSLVHTNKTLQKLRRMGVAYINERELIVEKEDLLNELAKVDSPLPAKRPLL